ncbi:prohibitin family protein [Segetibacter sp. 3557_3]|uniref:prohibitin family protein n=1 Tax=Segetibacter sp. 3557_3 TaxID=2547429 RepID=UPI001058FA45|nr:prohibitin family protein [Segetibacter sp. 3557_3]TDH24047.1 prohibitin family protein [Segetibacter sp. 3557_3]
MLLIILGVIVFFAAASLRKMNAPLPGYRGIVRLVGLAMIVIGILVSSVIQIDAGEIGIKSLFGKVQNDVLRSGLHLVNPVMEVQQLDVRTQNYTMSSVRDEGDNTGDDAIRVLTSDGLEVIIDLTVLYRVQANDAPKLVRETGYDFRDKIVRPVTRTKIRDNAVYYTAIDLYSTKRDEFQTRIFKTIADNFSKRGLEVEQLLIRNITLPNKVKAAIEEKINAEQEAQKMQFVLQKETQEAERKRVEAQGIADYQRIINTGLTDNQLQYEQIKALKEIATSQNAKVIIMGNKTPLIIDGKNP